MIHQPRLSWHRRLVSLIGALVFATAAHPALAQHHQGTQQLVEADELLGKGVHSIQVGEVKDPSFGATLAKRYFPTQEHAYLTGLSTTAWPDALAIGPVAGRSKTPLFITKEDGTLPSADTAYVRDQIRHLTILGGPSVVSPETEAYWRSKGKVITRISGESRYETAAEIAQTYWSSKASTVLIARADDAADAISAQPLGARLNAPILLTDRTELPDVTRAELLRLEPSEVILLGGVEAINPRVETAIRALFPSVKTTRISGSDRYATSEQIATSYFADVETVFAGINQDSNNKNSFATGRWADMFQLAPVAGSLGSPLYLRDSEQGYISLPVDLTVYGAHFYGVVGWITAPNQQGWGSVDAAWRQGALIRAKHGLDTKQSCTGTFTTRWRGWGGNTYLGDGSIWSSSWDVNNFLDSPPHMNVLLDPGSNYIRIIDETLRESHGDRYESINPNISDWMERRGLAIRVGVCQEVPGGQVIPIEQRRIGPNELTP